MIIDSYRFAAAGAFDFADYSPSLWLDSSDAATITESGGAVSQWDDKSANGFDVVQATAGKKPTTGTATQNGLNLLDFDGGDLLHRATGSQLVDASTGVFTVWAMVIFDTVAAGTAMVVNQDQNTGNRMPQMLRRNGSTLESVRIAGSVVVDAAGVTLSTATPYILRAKHTATTVETWVNGSSNGTSASSGSNGTSATAFQIAGYYDLTSNFVDGKIGFVYIVPSDLSSGDMGDIEAAINDQWAVY